MYLINFKHCLLVFLVSVMCCTIVKTYSNDYQMGYVSCIINETLPEEKLNFYIRNRVLYISLAGEDLEPRARERLLHRLQNTNFFADIQIKYNNTATIYKADLSHPHLVKNHRSHPTWEVLPPGVIYDAPIADPKWPRFSAGYSKHFRNTYGKTLFNLSFGENFSLIRYKTDGWTYELGVQAGLTGLMDMASSPSRLINSDYFVGAGLSFVYDRRWQNMLQFSHMSSHLGDEFLISRQDYIRRRINLSYEAFKWYSGYKFDSFRPYIGIGYLVDCDPRYLKPFTIEGGLDFISEQKFIYDTTRYVLGLFSHMWSQNNYKPSLSLRTGLQLDNPVWGGRHLQFLIDYSNGRSRHGQFFTKREEYIGIMVCVVN